MNEKTSLEEAQEFMEELERVKSLPDGTSNEVVPQPEKKEDVISWEAPYLVCTCGWKYKHTRLKVLNKAILKHMTKYGHQFKEKS